MARSTKWADIPIVQLAANPMDHAETEKKQAEIELRLEENAALIERQRLLIQRLQMLGEGPGPAETIIELARIQRALQAQHEALLKLLKP